jgi:hypothetical protein
MPPPPRGDSDAGEGSLSDVVDTGESRISGDNDIGEIQASAYTVKKGYRFFRLQPGCHLPNSLWPKKIKLFPPKESLVSDIPAGDRKLINFFYSVSVSLT